MWIVASQRNNGFRSFTQPRSVYINVTASPQQRQSPQERQRSNQQWTIDTTMQLVVIIIIVVIIMTTTTLIAALLSRTRIIVGIPGHGIAVVKAWSTSHTMTHSHLQQRLQRKYKDVSVSSSSKSMLHSSFDKIPAYVQYLQRNSHSESSEHHHDALSSFTKQSSCTNRRSFIQDSVLTSSIVVMNTVTTAKVHAAMDIDTGALRPATEDQPQIPFPDIQAMKDFESPPTTFEGTFCVWNDWWLRYDSQQKS